jgi:hypothetical protein
MADIAFINGDIMASNFGDILIVNDDDDITQMAINNIITVRGANEFHPNIGNTVYNGRYKMSENGLKEIANRCKDAIMSDNRVANVIEIVARNISTLDNYGKCEISFVLITIYGKQLSSNVTISLIG